MSIINLEYFRKEQVISDRGKQVMCTLCMGPDSQHTATKDMSVAMWGYRHAQWHLSQYSKSMR